MIALYLIVSLVAYLTIGYFMGHLVAVETFERVTAENNKKDPRQEATQILHLMGLFWPIICAISTVIVFNDHMITTRKQRRDAKIAELEQKLREDE